jgi:hypothetical protein
LLETMTTVFKYVGCGNVPRLDMNTHFIGRNKEMWAVFIYALRYNYQDFLPENLLASIGQQIQA